MTARPPTPKKKRARAPKWSPEAQVFRLLFGMLLDGYAEAVFAEETAKLRAEGGEK